MATGIDFVETYGGDTSEQATLHYLGNLTIPKPQH